MKKLCWALIACVLLSMAGFAQCEETAADEQTVIEEAAETIVKTVFLDTADDEEELIVGEVEKFLSRFDGKKARMTGIRLFLDDGKRIEIDADAVTNYFIESTIVWQYVYANASSEVSDIVIGDSTVFNMRSDMGEECKLQVGSILGLLRNKGRSYRLIYVQNIEEADETENAGK